MPTSRSEAGQLGGIEALGFGLLVFIVGVLVIANVWSAIDTKLAASAAAREAARVYVEADDVAAAESAAVRAARDAIAGYGRDPSHMDVRFTGETFGRCRRVTTHVEYAVRLGAIPLIGRTIKTLRVSARHSEIVDPYRSGLDGEAHCAE